MSADLQPVFERAAQARRAIADVVAAVRSGELDLAGAFERADREPLVGRCFAVKVFEAVPEIGKVRARRTMEDIGLAEDIWIRDVPPVKRDEIMAAFAEPESDLV